MHVCERLVVVVGMWYRPRYNLLLLQAAKSKEWFSCVFHKLITNTVIYYSYNYKNIFSAFIGKKHNDKTPIQLLKSF